MGCYTYLRFRYWHVVFILLILTGCDRKNSDRTSGSETSKAPPNIIFLLTDDQRWDALGAMGNNTIQTPHLDKLAEAGILFKNAYVTTSICATSRASILSGQYMSRHRIEDFKTSFDSAALHHTYPILLKNAGYKIGFIGKYGVGHVDHQPGSYYDFWSVSEKGQPDYEMEDEDGNYLHHTQKVNNDIQRFLNKYSDQSPFCLSVSFKAPHVQGRDPRQFIPDPRYMDLYQNDSIPLPKTAANQYWEMHPDFFRTEENIGRERWHLRFDTPEKYQESVKNYYRLITGVDEVVGDMVRTLEEKGLNENTVIMFMGDNGFFLGEHGLAGKWYGYEESVRVPLIMHYPGLKKEHRGLRAELMALNIDIAPTILSIAGQEVPANMQGRDLLSMIDKPGLRRQQFFYEHTFWGSPRIPKQEGLVTANLKYMLFTEHNYEQLFDLRNDPHEIDNLVNDPDYQDKLNEMRRSYQQMKEEVK